MHPLSHSHPLLTNSLPYTQTHGTFMKISDTNQFLLTFKVKYRYSISHNKLNCLLKFRNANKYIQNQQQQNIWLNIQIPRVF